MKYFITIFLTFLISFSSCHRPTHTSSVTYCGYNETPVYSPISVKYDTVRSVFLLITDKDTIEKCKVIYGREPLHLTNNRRWILTTYYDTLVRQTKTQFSYAHNDTLPAIEVSTFITTNNLICSTEDYVTIKINNMFVKTHVLRCRNNKCYYTFMNDTAVYIANIKDMSQIRIPFECNHLEYQPFDIVRCTENFNN